MKKWNFYLLVLSVLIAISTNELQQPSEKDHKKVDSEEQMIKTEYESKLKENDLLKGIIDENFRVIIFLGITALIMFLIITFLVIKLIFDCRHAKSNQNIIRGRDKIYHPQNLEEVNRNNPPLEQSNYNLLNSNNNLNNDISNSNNNIHNDNNIDDNVQNYDAPKIAVNQDIKIEDENKTLTNDPNVFFMILPCIFLFFILIMIDT